MPGSWVLTVYIKMDVLRACPNMFMIFQRENGKCSVFIYHISWQKWIIFIFKFVQMFNLFECTYLDCIFCRNRGGLKIIRYRKRRYFLQYMTFTCLVVRMRIDNIILTSSRWTDGQIYSYNGYKKEKINIQAVDCLNVSICFSNSELR